jgi:hypothetical protein
MFKKLELASPEMTGQDSLSVVMIGCIIHSRRNPESCREELPPRIGHRPANIPLVSA